jgi:HSP20 family protein
MQVTKRDGGTKAMSPWSELDRMQNRLRRMFESPFDTDLFTESVGWSPAVEVSETENELTVTAELPGMSRDDVEIDLENNVLTIRGEKSSETEEEDMERKVHVWERRYGSFHRAFTLPRTVDADGVKAEFRDGILKVHLPKTEQAKGKKIAIDG